MEFDAESKFAKIQNSYVWWGREEVGFVEFDAESKFANIQNSYVWWDWGGGSWNLMLSPNFLISKIPMGGGTGGGFMEFDAESKFAKIQNFYVWGGGFRGI